MLTIAISGALLQCMARRDRFPWETLDSSVSTAAVPLWSHRALRKRLGQKNFLLGATEKSPENLLLLNGALRA